MKIKYYGTMQILTGSESDQVELAQASTVNQVFGWLFKRYPQIRAAVYNEQGKLDAQIPLFVNGRNPRLEPDGLNKPLQPEDVLTLFSPISSGKINVEAAQKASQDYYG